MADRHSIRIEQTGTSGRILLDGTDITSAVRSLRFAGEAGAHPRVTLDLAIHDVTTVSSPDTELLIPEDTAAALVALGWTPPTGEPTDGERIASRL